MQPVPESLPIPPSPQKIMYLIDYANYFDIFQALKHIGLTPTQDMVSETMALLKPLFKIPYFVLESTPAVYLGTIYHVSYFLQEMSEGDPFGRNGLYRQYRGDLTQLQCDAEARHKASEKELKVRALFTASLSGASYGFTDIRRKFQLQTPEQIQLTLRKLESEGLVTHSEWPTHYHSTIDADKYPLKKDGKEQEYS